MFILCLLIVLDFFFWVKWNKLGVKLINVGKYIEVESEIWYIWIVIIWGFIIIGYLVYCYFLIVVIFLYVWCIISVFYWLYIMFINKKKICFLIIFVIIVLKYVFFEMWLGNIWNKLIINNWYCSLKIVFFFW